MATEHLTTRRVEAGGLLNKLGGLRRGLRKLFGVNLRTSVSGPSQVPEGGFLTEAALHGHPLLETGTKIKATTWRSSNDGSGYSFFRPPHLDDQI